MADAKRDENRIPTLLGVSSVDGTTPVPLYADPTTHRLYVDLAAGGTTTVDAGTTTTLDAGESATVVNSGTTTDAVFDFGIPKGDTGATGATGATGPIGITWEGEYNARTAYTVNDGVEYNGSSYICIQDGTGQTPDPAGTAYWDLVALKGTDGAGSGDVNGPASAVDSRIATFDGTTGKLIKDGGNTIAEIANATHTGEVTGATALTITNDVVSNTKLANMATSTIKGRVTAATGDPEDLTATQVRTLINVEDGADVTDTANVTSAGALMDSEITDITAIKTLSAPDNTNITTAAATVLDDATVAAMVDTLGGAASTGTGGLVRATSPTLVTPSLGTPASGTLTNCTGLPTTGLVDDAVTLAKMASGTAGNLITYDASGNPAAVATGTANQVLTSNGAGAAPTFQDAAGGGTWELIAEAQLSTASATLINKTSISTDYDMFKITVYVIMSNNEAGSCRMQLNGDTGGNYANQYRGSDDSVTSAGRDPSTAHFTFDAFQSVANNGGSLGGVFTIHKPLTTTPAMLTSETISWWNTAELRSYSLTGRWNNTTEKIDEIYIYTHAGTFAAGSYVVIEGHTIT